MRVMRSTRKRPIMTAIRLLLALLLPLLVPAPQASAQTTTVGPSQALITQSINESVAVTLAGNTRPEARNPANDLGVVPDSLPMNHMFLQLRRPAAQQQAVQALIDQLHDPKSPNYHHWLSAAEIGARFGPAQSDITTVTGWLGQHGFAVNRVYPNGMVIDFSGTAGQVRTAFHTEIHNLSVNGVAHIANMTDPQIPAALSPAVVGVVALHDFAPHPQYGRSSSAKYSVSNCSQVLGATCYPVAPGDLATIYNINPLYSSGITGANVTIYLIEDTDLFNNSDWTNFRNGFGLTTAFPTASFATVHPGGCADPGVGAEDDYTEATLDVEWSSAAAPGAAIVLASCHGGFPSGIMTSIQNVVAQTNPPGVVSISYGECETKSGAANNQAISTVFETGVMEGMSIFVAAGDEGPMSCTPHDNAPSGFGIGVDSMASTPYNVATGGTDFGDTYLGVNSTYWNAINTPAFGSAKSYIPEIPWNATCGSQLLALSQGVAVTYGSSGFCNSSLVTGDPSDYLTGWAGSGGPSACATGATAVAGSGVVSGTCAGWAKPSYQNGMTPNDGVRDIPDVAMFASESPWGHAFLVCSSTPGNPCAGTTPDEWCCYYGTSFTAPIMAGVQALVNQYTGTIWGNPNYRYYQIAGAEFGPAGSTICNSTRGNAISGKCVFNDVTMGDNIVPCRADAGSLNNCYRPSGTNGVMSTSNNSYAPAYQAGIGWDFATGLGSLNVTNLVTSFKQPYYGLWLTDSHDFNGDGDSDILWRDTSGNVSLWLMNGTAVSQSKVLGALAPIWSVVGQRDFNGDGNSDILWRDTSGDVAIWLMNGTQVTSATLLGTVSTTWSVGGTGDFNNDGKGDILWIDTAGNIGVWLMNGTTVLQSAIVAQLPPNWIVVGSDMKGDVFLRNTASGEAGMWVISGMQVTKTVDFGAVPLSWTVAGIGDFDGNGSTDILWRDNLGNVGIWLMNGTSIMSSTVLGQAPLGWSVAQIGDYNGDGKSDVLWIDTSGNVGAWLMNGASISSATTFANVGTTWGVQALSAE